jgi:hypothetical protein
MTSCRWVQAAGESTRSASLLLIGPTPGGADRDRVRYSYVHVGMIFDVSCLKHIFDAGCLRQPTQKIEFIFYIGCL